MTQTMLRQLLATATKIDGPEEWIHLCATAADEAGRAEAEAVGIPSVRHMIEKVKRAEEAMDKAIKRDALDDEYACAAVLAVAKAYRDGTLVQASGGSAAASLAYRANLPSLTNRSSVQCFIACVAAGVLRGYIAAKDANQLLYVAQIALSAFPKRTARKARK